MKLFSLFFLSFRTLKLLDRDPWGQLSTCLNLVKACVCVCVCVCVCMFGGTVGCGGTLDLSSTSVATWSRERLKVKVTTSYGNFSPVPHLELIYKTAQWHLPYRAGKTSTESPNWGLVEINIEINTQGIRRMENDCLSEWGGEGLGRWLLLAAKMFSYLFAFNHVIYFFD